MDRVGISGAEDGCTLLTNHGVAVPVAAGNDLLHHSRRAGHQLVNSAFVGAGWLRRHHRRIHGEGGGISALGRVAIKVILRTLARTGATDVVQLVTNNTEEITIRGIEHAELHRGVGVPAHRDTKGRRSDASGLVREGLLGDQACNVAVRSRGGQQNFSCRLLKKVVDLGNSGATSRLLVLSPDVGVDIDEVCVIEDRQRGLDARDAQQVITNL